MADKPGETDFPEGVADPNRKNIHANLSPGPEDLLTAAESSPDVAKAEPQIGDNDVAAQNNDDGAGPSQYVAHRKHGGAVPK